MKKIISITLLISTLVIVGCSSKVPSNTSNTGYDRAINASEKGMQELDKETK